MIRILTSDFKNYEKKDGVKITHPMSNENGIVDLLKTVLKETKKVVFVASDINSTPDSVESYARIFFDSMKMVGITFDEYYILDGTKVDKAREYIEEHRINNPYHYEYNCFMRNARASDLLEILKGE